MPLFARYIGIDYSGAETIASQLPGLCVYSATPSSDPVEIRPKNPSQKHWTRETLAQWLANELLDGPATLVGIDHAFSFPLAYFKTHQVSARWETFLEDFEDHWPTREPHMYVDFIREGVAGHGAERAGNSKWRRLCDVRARAKSVFHFDVPGSVAKATHAGLPWLRFLREHLGEHVHFWPFDGWVPDEHQSVIAEIYPALWKSAYPKDHRNSHQQDAYVVARWMREADAGDELVRALHPHLSPDENATALTEGWILGLGGAAPDAAAAEVKSPKSGKAPQKTGAKKAATKKATKTAPMKKAKKTTRARERIHEIADKVHGYLVTPRQFFLYQATFGSLDDTLDENEVLSILEAMPPDFSDIPRDELILIEIDRDFKITGFPAPPFPHDPTEYRRKHPRR